MNIQTALALSTAPSSSFDDFALRVLRVAFVKSRILTNAIEVAGVALRADLISGEQAIADVVAAGGSGLITWESS